jgi:hypothetical protein
MLKRAAALDQRAREREPQPRNGKVSKDQLREVLKAKGFLKGE